MSSARLFAIPIVFLVLDSALGLVTRDRRLSEQQGDFSDEHEFVVRTRDLVEAPDFSRNAGQLYRKMLKYGYRHVT